MIDTPNDRPRCCWAGRDPLMIAYHDEEWGQPCRDDHELFARLALDSFQSGLSWAIILKKRDGFRHAFDSFDPVRIAAYGPDDIALLLADPGIVRNRAKIEATIANARTILELASKHGSFAAWIAAHHPRSRPEWVKLFRQTFRFAGPEIVGEFLMSIGYLPGAHRPDCPVQPRILKLKPPWNSI